MENKKAVNKNMLQAFIEKRDYLEAFKTNLRKFANTSERHQNSEKIKALKAIFERLVSIDDDLKSVINEEKVKFQSGFLKEHELKSFIDRLVITFFIDLFNNKNVPNIIEEKRDILNLKTYRNLLSLIIFEHEVKSGLKKEEKITASYYFEDLENIIGKKQITFVKNDEAFFVEDNKELRPLKTPIELAILISELAKRDVKEEKICYHPLTYEKSKGNDFFISLSEFFNHYYDIIEKMARIKKEKVENFLKFEPKGFLHNNYIFYNNILSYDLKNKKFVLNNFYENNENNCYILKSDEFYELMIKAVKSCCEKNRHNKNFFGTLLKTLNLPENYVSIYDEISRDIEKFIYNAGNDKIIKNIRDLAFNNIYSDKEKEIYLLSVIFYTRSLLDDLINNFDKDIRQPSYIFKCFIIINETTFLLSSNEMAKHIINNTISKILDFYAKTGRVYHLKEILKEIENNQNFYIIKDFAKQKLEEAAINFIKKCKEKGWYDQLHRLIQDKDLSYNVRKMAKENISWAFKKFIEDCLKFNNYPVLLEIPIHSKISKEMFEVLLPYYLKIASEHGQYYYLIRIKSIYRNILNDKEMEEINKAIQESAKNALKKALKGWDYKEILYMLNNFSKEFSKDVLKEAKKVLKEIINKKTFAAMNKNESVYELKEIITETSLPFSIKAKAFLSYILFINNLKFEKTANKNKKDKKEQKQKT